MGTDEITKAMFWSFLSLFNNPTNIISHKIVGLYYEIIFDTFFPHNIILPDLEEALMQQDHTYEI